MLFACASSAMLRADGSRDQSSVAAMVKAIEVKQAQEIATQTQEEQMREQMAVRRLALTDAAASEPRIRILALALKPAEARERFRRRLPTGAWVEALQAIDGSNLTGTCNAVVNVSVLLALRAPLEFLFSN